MEQQIAPPYVVEAKKKVAADLLRSPRQLLEKIMLEHVISLNPDNTEIRNSIGSFATLLVRLSLQADILQRWLIWLTVILVFLTVILVVLTVVLLFKT